MRNIHPAAWAGLFLNFALGYFLFSTLLGMDISMLETQDQEFWGAVKEAVLAIRPFYYGMLALQAVSVGLIATGFGFGLGLSIVSSFFMLPGAAIYMVGCALSHYRVKFAAFATAPPDYTGAHFVFIAHVLSKTRVMTGAVMLTALLCMLLGSFDIGLTMLGIGFAGVYCTMRAARHHALSLHDDHFTVTPALFAGRLAVPYDAVRQATLNADESIVFTVETPSGQKELRWNLQAVRPQERRAALEELGAALTAHRVTLH